MDNSTISSLIRGSFIHSIFLTTDDTSNEILNILLNLEKKSQEKLSSSQKNCARLLSYVKIFHPSDKNLFKEIWDSAQKNPDLLMKKLESSNQLDKLNSSGNFINYDNININNMIHINNDFNF